MDALGVFSRERHRLGGFKSVEAAQHRQLERAFEGIPAAAGRGLGGEVSLPGIHCNAFHGDPLR